MTTSRTKPATAKQLTIADRFEEARELFRQENYQLPQARRRTRANSFVKALNEVSQEDF